MVAMIRREGNTGKRNPKEKITAPGQRRKKKAHAGSQAGRKALVHQRRELVPPFCLSKNRVFLSPKRTETQGIFSKEKIYIYFSSSS
jgi:hypothetical protein